MDVREKLVEIVCDAMEADGCIGHCNHPPCFAVERVVNALIANGVTVQEWISVKDRLPENEVDVLICAERRLYGLAGGERKTVRVIASAFHTDGKMNTENSGYNWELDNVEMEYDEEADAYIVPEGWWETVRYGEEFSAVDDFVTHWMPLPQPPKGE